jgi:DNA mismatch repair protein MSH2
VAERTKQISVQYSQLQSAVVEKAVETARTYTPLIESASALIAELDVLSSFATTAALAAVEYVRPVVHPLGFGLTRILKGRHPCVELMDAVEFIPNDCVLDKAASNFQIITGPNMVC